MKLYCKTPACCLDVGHNEACATTYTEMILRGKCKRLEDELEEALKKASMWETTSLCQAAEIDRLHQEIDRLLQLL